MRSMPANVQLRSLDNDLMALVRAGEEFDFNRIPFLLEAGVW